MLGGSSYVAFVVPGLLVTTAMALAAGESMWPVMGGLRWNRGYHGIAATPLDAGDIVLGHATWMALRCGIATAAVALVLACFGETRSWGLAPERARRDAGRRRVRDADHGVLGVGTRWTVASPPSNGS